MPPGRRVSVDPGSPKQKRESVDEQIVVSIQDIGQNIPARPGIASRFIKQEVRFDSQRPQGHGRRDAGRDFAALAQIAGVVEHQQRPAFGADHFGEDGQATLRLKTCRTAFVQ